MINTDRSKKQIIRDFIEFYNKPFTVSIASDETGVNRSTVYTLIQHFREIGLIKIILIDRRNRIYIKNPDYVKVNCKKEPKEVVDTSIKFPAVLLI